MSPKPSRAERERAMGALVGCAVGAALGAAYIGDIPGPQVPEMSGRRDGDWEPGEWTAAPQLAICIAQAARGSRLQTDAVAARFRTRFSSPGRHIDDESSDALGNASVARTAPVALAHLADDEAIATAAREISALTHTDPLCGDACVLWSIAIDRAIREERLDGVDDALAWVPSDRRDDWRVALIEARSARPEAFVDNADAVPALQLAISSISHTDERSPIHFIKALINTIRVGGETANTGAIAGSLLGARWGIEAIPERWTRTLHGWPGLDASGLGALAVDVLPAR